MPCSELSKYVNKRDEYINAIKQKYNIGRDKAKTLIIRLLYLGSYDKWLTENNFTEKIDFLEKFSNEMNKISKVVSENNPELCKYLKTVKDKAKKSSIITYYLQTIECNILEELFNYCRKNGIVKNICVLSNDGIMIPKDNYKDSL